MPSRHAAQRAPELVWSLSLTHGVTKLRVVGPDPVWDWASYLELVHAELSQIWEFVAIFPRHAVGPVQQSDAAAPTARIALETSSCASARSQSKPHVDWLYRWLSGQDGLLTPTASADEAA